MYDLPSGLSLHVDTEQSVLQSVDKDDKDVLLLAHGGTAGGGVLVQACAGHRQEVPCKQSLTYYM